MFIKKSEQLNCEFCKQDFFIRQYEGAGEAWYTDHHCKGYLENLAHEEKTETETQSNHSV